jgi:hypothetical protein
MMKSLKCMLMILSIPLMFPVFGYEQSPAGVASTHREGQEESSPQAREFDEYEMNRASIGDMKARLDGFFVELQKEQGSRAYIFIYGSKRAAPRYRSATIKDYLELRGLSPSRLKIVRGGNRSEPMLEFWVVPQGAEPPKAAPPFQAKVRKRR